MPHGYRDSGVGRLLQAKRPNHPGKRGLSGVGETPQTPGRGQCCRPRCASRVFLVVRIVSVTPVRVSVQAKPCCTDRRFVRVGFDVRTEVRSSEGEREAWRTAAEGEGFSLSLWIRRTLNAAAAGAVVPLEVDPPPLGLSESHVSFEPVRPSLPFVPSLGEARSFGGPDPKDGKR